MKFNLGSSRTGRQSMKRFSRPRAEVPPIKSKWSRNSLRLIFRDCDEFSAGHKIAGQTLAAFDGSEARIIMCYNETPINGVKRRVGLFGKVLVSLKSESCHVNSARSRQAAACSGLSRRWDTGLRRCLSDCAGDLRWDGKADNFDLLLPIARLPIKARAPTSLGGRLLALS